MKRFPFLMPSCIIVFVVIILHTTKLWRGSYFFWLLVMKIRGRRDDDVRLRRLLSANAAGAESGGHPEVVK